MRKTPIVLGSTAVGLGLVLTFHTHSPSLSKLSVGGTSTSTDPTTSTTSPAAPSGSSAATSPPTTTAPSATRTGTGQDIQYRYGDIQLRVTKTGSRITNIKVIQNGAVDARSQEINSQAVPMLQEQAMQAQSANIDGVTGATFTSYAYAQSLQSALDHLNA